MTKNYRAPQNTKYKAWNFKEIKIYKILLKHFGADFKVIAYEMNRTFQYEKIYPCIVK